MKRKVAQIGPSTLMISLPSIWVKKYGITKGDELDVDILDRSLVVQHDKDFADIHSSTRVDVRGLDERLIRWILSTLHKTGYDQITVLYDTNETLEVLQEVVRDLFMGFVIVDQTDEKCVIKSVSKDLDDQFDIIFRRAFLVTLSMADNCLELIEKRAFNKLGRVASLEKSNNQFTNFCERSINKHGYKDHKKNSFLYVINWNLEKICDDYKYICQHLHKSKQKEVSEQLIVNFKKTNELLKSYYELFYKFDMQRLNEITQYIKDIKQQLKEVYDSHNKDDMIIANHLLAAVTKMSDFSASMIGLHYISSSST